MTMSAQTVLGWIPRYNQLQTMLHYHPTDAAPFTLSHFARL